MFKARPTPVSAALGAAGSLLLMLATGPQTSRAEQAIGVTTTGGLFSFDTVNPTGATVYATVTGIDTGLSIKGVDFRPATNEFYAFAANANGSSGRLYTINTLTGVATGLGAGPLTLGGPTSTAFGVDFNPVANALRVVGNGGANYRFSAAGALVSTDANLAYNTGDVNYDPTGVFTPAVVSAAYSNNVAGAATTTLYGFDLTNTNFTIQGGLNGNPSPNTGQLNSLNSATGIAGGDLTSPATQNVAFDISSATGIAFFGAVVATGGSENLYTVDLTNENTTLVGTLPAGLSVQDFALSITPVAVPEPGSLVLLGVGGGLLVLASRHRRRHHTTTTV